MNLQNDILAYEVAPPADLWDCLTANLDEIDLSENRVKELGSYEVTPPADVWLAISKALNTPVKKEVTPQKKQTPVKSITQKKSFFTQNRAIVYIAAACLVIGGIFTLYKIANVPAKAPPHLAVTNQQQPSIPNSPPVVEDSITDSVSNAENVAAIPADQQHLSRRKSTSTAKPKEELVVTHIFDIEDEDAFFLTLANYVLPQANKSGNKKISIRIDQYSTVFISQKMTLFMRNLYERTPTNKPTRIARRSYRTLRSWKKACARYFDEADDDNISNVFDLANFLQKHRKL